MQITISGRPFVQLLSLPDVETSIQSIIDQLITDPHREQMDSLYECQHCKPVRTVATQERTLINIEKYIILQLKVFGYNKHTQSPFKIVPNLKIEEEITNLVLGKFRLCSIVYHIGDSSFQGHYVCSVKENHN